MIGNFPPAPAPAQTAPKPATDRSVCHYNQMDLAHRWNISPRTLERWRWLKQGPRYLKIGGRVKYRIEDIEAFEAARVENAGQQGDTPDEQGER